MILFYVGRYRKGCLDQCIFELEYCQYILLTMILLIPHLRFYRPHFIVNSLFIFSKVLHLQGVSLYSVAPIGGKPHMNVSTTVIYISLSPATIKTVMACLTVMSEQQVSFAYLFVHFVVWFKLKLNLLP